MTTQLQFFLITIAGWMNRHQQAIIDYLQKENRVLLEQLGGKPRRSLKPSESDCRAKPSSLADAA